MARNKYFVPEGRVADYPHHAPERTCYRYGRGIFSDLEFRVFSNRAAMLVCCRKSEGTKTGGEVWRPLVKG